MSANPSSDPLWPRFWSDVPESDRAPLREVLAELLGRGVLLGDEGSGRDLFSSLVIITVRIWRTIWHRWRWN